MAHLNKLNATVILSTLFIIKCCSKSVEPSEARKLIHDEDQAWKWIMEYNERAQELYSKDTITTWNYYTNLTDYNQQVSVNSSIAMSASEKETAFQASQFAWRTFKNDTLRRLFSKLAVLGKAILPPHKIELVDSLRSSMERTYSVGEVCKEDGKTCLNLDPDLTRLFATSRDYDELLWAWKAWRDVTGRQMRDTYVKFAEIQNEAAIMNGFEDNGDYWRHWYEMDDFEGVVAALWQEVKPLYRELHAYVRRRLEEVYGTDKMPKTGHIPAHLLGNMWGQTWGNLYPMLKPYPNATAMNVTETLKQKGYNITTLFQLTEEFFISLGMDPLPDSFWTDSMLERPKDGRDVVCHASAWDFYNQKDFRIKQCTDITFEWLITTHHEMGHIQYFMQYKDLPVIFRDGPNPGFHEAIGDVMSLSVSTPKHLQKIGLLEELQENKESEINYLMSQALDKVAFLPFGYLIDLWRWSVYNEQTPSTLYNTHWWDLRCKYQGLSPPITRTEKDFDPGAKFHVAGDSPYIRYFVSYILQFQIHEGLCKEANQTGPLHRCDIYRSKSAGKKFRDMLKLGASVKWPEALRQVTGVSEMNATALLDYFKPLTEWLHEQNKGHRVGWDEQCPPGTMISSSPTINVLLHSLLMSAIAILLNKICIL